MPKPEPQNAHANVGVPARALPCADIIDNCRNITEHDSQFAPVFLREKRDVLAQMVKVEAIY
jgi:hypothetical protein